jgi:hypothetical protein
MADESGALEKVITREANRRLRQGDRDGLSGFRNRARHAVRELRCRDALRCRISGALLSAEAARLCRNER